MSLRSWLRRRRLSLDEADFQDEIRAHLAIAERERREAGVDARSAREASLKDFGNVTLTTEAARQVWSPRWLTSLWDVAGDVRFACRSLIKNPAFSVTVIGVLALGIGLNGVVFTMLKGLALNPLSGVAGSSRLTVIYAEAPGGHQMRVSYPDFEQLRQHDQAFQELMGSSLITAGLGRGRSSRSIWGELVTGNYFDVLGVRAERGRVLQPSDGLEPGRHPVAVISDSLWRSDFSSDPDVIGKTIEVNHYPLTIVGVADPSFHGTIVGYEVEVYAPIMMTGELGVLDGLQPPVTSAQILGSHSAPTLFPHGYLRSGVSLASASAQTTALWTRLTSDRPPADRAVQMRLARFAEAPTGAQMFLLPSLLMLSAMGLLVLAIACANIAGLVVVRGLSRRGEVALRLALGASRLRIVRLLVVENLVLAIPAAILGVLLAARGIPIFTDYAQSQVAPERLFFNMSVDRIVIAFAVIVGCGCALLCGFLPALRGSRLDLVTVLNDASPRGSERGRLRSALVIAQVAVSLLLLVGAGLVTRSLEAARSANPGFEADHVTTMAVDLRQNGYDVAQGRAFYRKLLDAARTDPGVESATLAALNPLGVVDSHIEHAAVEGYSPRADEDLGFMYNTIGPNYFRTLRIPLRSGREFADADDQDTEQVAIVNTTFAERFWGGADRAVGKRVRLGTGAWRTVVGVAADIKYSRINEGPRPYVYVPFFQSYLSLMLLQTRGPASVDLLVNQARAHVVALDPDLPIQYAKPLSTQIRGALFFYDLTATVLFAFGLAGIVLAALGTYGLVSYAVRQSTREIGIRVALGARRSSVIRTFAARGLRLGLAGTAIGLVTALGTGRLLRSLLFGVTPTDVVSFAAALTIILTGVLLATIVPAWRASRTDPVRALRHQ